EEGQEFFFAERGLLQNPLEQGWRNVFRVDGYSHAQLWLGSMEQTGMAAGLVVDVESGLEKGANDFLRPKNRQLPRHSIQPRVTPTCSVAGSMSLGIGSPVWSALSRKHRIASWAISRASASVSPNVQISGIAGTTTL